MSVLNQVATKTWQNAIAVAESSSGSPKDIDRLNQIFEPELTRWAFNQSLLRQRAKTKFKRSSEMLFSRISLEMASHESVAQWHASLFPHEVRIFDLTAGIGSDSIAFSKRGPVTSVEILPEHADYLEWNLSLHGGDFTVICDDSQKILQENHCEYIFLDPARRVENRRLVNPDDFSPNLKTFIPLLKNSKLSVIKLSPMLADEFLSSLGGTLHFVSFQNECREAVVVLGKDVPVMRLATQVEYSESIHSSDQIQIASAPNSYVYEVDPAAIRAHALGNFDMEALGDSPGYLTSNRLQSSNWLTVFEVLWNGKWQEKLVKSELKKLNAQIDAIKLRGVKEDPAQLKKAFKEKKGELLTLILYRQNKSIRAVLARRIS